MKISSIIIITFILLLTTISNSATFKIKSFERMDSDLRAIKEEVKDVNGDLTALIKVRTDIIGLQFDSGLFPAKVENKTGEYYVYLSEGDRRISFLKEGFTRFDFTFPEDIKKNVVYYLELLTINDVKKLENISINVISKPSGATIYLDNENKGKKKKIMTSIGSHQLRIEKDGFQTISKTITVSANDNYFEYNLEEV